MTSIVILAVISWGLVAFWFVYTACIKPGRSSP